MNLNSSIQKRIRLIFSTILIFVSLQSSGQTIVTREITKSLKNKSFSKDYGDLNNDGYRDFVSFGNNLVIYWGRPNVEFREGQTIYTGTVPVSPGNSTCRLGMMNADNLLDIVINQINPGKLIVLINNGDETFSPQVIDLNQNLMFTFECYDINVDGIDDLFLTTTNFSAPLNSNYYTHSYILNSNTNFSQEYQMNTSLGLASNSGVEVIDVNEDGVKDLKFLNKVLINEPGNPFTNDTRLEELLAINFLFTYPALEGIISDLNQDGTLDYIYADQYSIRFRLDNGSNGISPDTLEIVNTGGFNISGFEQIEYNGDSYPEFLYKVSDSIFVLEYDVTTNSFDRTFFFRAENSWGGLEVTDFNQDGNFDLIVNDYIGSDIYINTGSFNFINKGDFFFDSSPAGGKAFGDIDNNGLDDIIIQNERNQLVYSKQIAPGEYSAFKVITTSYDALQISLMDVENDGDNDLIVSMYYNSGSPAPSDLLNYYLNDGTGNFTGPYNLTANFQPTIQKIEDINNDGFTDLVESDVYNGVYGRLTVLRNDHPGFTRLTVANSISAGSTLPFEIVDMDQNGFKDLLFADGNAIKCLYNVGGVFQAQPVVMINNQSFLWGKLSVWDLNTDGYQDVVVVSNDSIYVYENTTSNSLLLKNTYLPNTPFLDDLTAIDFDRDNDLDIIYTNDNYLNVLRNYSNFDFGSDTSIYIGFRIVMFDEKKDQSGVILNTYCEDFDQAVFSMKEFIPGNLPLLQNTVFSACPNDTIILELDNATELNDNLTWSLFADSCNGQFLASNVTGVFEIYSNFNRNYYIKATGNASFNGACQEIQLNVTNANPPISVAEIHIDTTTLILEINSPAGIPQWEYSMNDGLTWVSVLNQNDSLTIQSLTPNTEYNFLVRPQGPVGSCDNWQSDQLNFHTDCNVIEVSDTVNFCFGEMVSYPDYQLNYIYSDTVNEDVHLISASGCDSLIHFVAIAYPHVETYDTISACRYSNLILPDGSSHFIMIETTIPAYLNSMNGCDSLVYYYVTVLEPSFLNIPLQICHGHEYYWPQTGLTYYANGLYYDTLVNQAGCDSVIKLDLSFTSELIDSIVSSCDSYLWSVNGTNYTTSGIYTDTILNSSNCDSIIYRLNLTIIPSLPVTIENSFSMPSDANNCVGEVAVTVSGNADFELDFDNGSQIVTSSGYSLVTNLCSGIHDLYVTGNCGDTLSATLVIPVDSNYVFNNPFIDSLAQDSLGVTMTNCDIYYAGIDTAYIDSIWANGNTVNVIWNIVDSNGSNFDTTSYVLNNGNGVYWLQLSVFCPNKSVGEYFTVTEAVYFQNGHVSTAGLSDHELSLFEVYPNPTNDQVHISFSGSDAELTVYDLQGKVVLKDRIQNQGIVSLQNFERGVYLFDFKNSQGHSVQRVVKQ